MQISIQTLSRLADSQFIYRAVPSLVLTFKIMNYSTGKLEKQQLSSLKVSRAKRANEKSLLKSLSNKKTEARDGDLYNWNIFEPLSLV